MIWFLFNGYKTKTTVLIYLNWCPKYLLAFFGLKDFIHLCCNDFSNIFKTVRAFDQYDKLVKISNPFIFHNWIFYLWCYSESSFSLLWQIKSIFLLKNIGTIMNQSFKLTFPICYWKWCFALRMKYFLQYPTHSHISWNSNRHDRSKWNWSTKFKSVRL